LISGYFAMLAGRTVHEMLISKDQNVRITGIATCVVTILFLIYAWRRGTGKAIKNLVIPFVLLAAVGGIIMTVSRLGTGYGILYQLIALMFVVIMLVVGTIARATVHTLSVILFIVVAVLGSIFGKSIGGGLGPTIMALACAQISKRALSDTKGFERLRNIAFYVTKKLGTSFRNANLSNADFSKAKIRNTDFSDTDVLSITWTDTKPINSIIGEKIFILKPENHG